MYSSHRSQDGAPRSGSWLPTEGRTRESFPPVALPALAAAVHVGRTAAESVRARLAAPRTARIVHEDEPFL